MKARLTKGNGQYASSILSAVSIFPGIIQRYCNAGSNTHSIRTASAYIMRPPQQAHDLAYLFIIQKLEFCLSLLSFFS